MEIRVMEVEEAPSGFVTLYNYKEPFMKFETGFGFEGVLLMDGKTDQVQCHFCGDWFNYLPYHLHKEHNMTAEQYKDKVGLRQSSALLSENARTNLIKAGLERRLQNLVPGKAKTEEEKKKITETLTKNRLVRQEQNRLGTCPLQLITRLQDLKKKLGRTPLSHEITFRDTVIKVFGSMKETKRRAGIEPNYNQGMKKIEIDYSKGNLIELLQKFKEQEGRYPSSSDLSRALLPCLATFVSRFGTWRKAMRAAFPNIDREKQIKAIEKRAKELAVEKEQKN